MTTPEARGDPIGAAAAAAQTLLVSLAVCEAVASDALEDPVQGSGAVLQARRLRGRTQAAVSDNSRHYLRAQAQLEIAATGQSHTTGRDATLRAALVDTADSLIALVTAASDTAVLAAELAVSAVPSRRPDAVGATELALGATRCLRHLVDVNLAVRSGDERSEQAAQLAAFAEQAGGAALASIEQD